MRLFNTRLHVAVGLTAIVTTTVVFAMLLGFVPDHLAPQRQARVQLAETVAASATALLTAGEVKRLESVLRYVKSRNPGVESVAVRERAGRLLVDTGGHEQRWRPMQRRCGRESCARARRPYRGRSRAAQCAMRSRSPPRRC